MRPPHTAKRGSHDSPGEHELLERLRRLVRQPPPWVQLGIGDDAAILEPDRGSLTAVNLDAPPDSNEPPIQLPCRGHQEPGGGEG